MHKQKCTECQIIYKHLKQKSRETARRERQRERSSKSTHVQEILLLKKTHTYIPHTHTHILYACTHTHCTHTHTVLTHIHTLTHSFTCTHQLIRTQVTSVHTNITHVYIIPHTHISLNTKHSR